MSGLSANTYSCGGEGSRFFLAGGVACFAALGAPLKYRSRLPTCIGSDAISISEESAEESGERSEEDMSNKVGGGGMLSAAGLEVSEQREISSVKLRVSYYGRLIKRRTLSFLQWYS